MGFTEPEKPLFRQRMTRVLSNVPGAICCLFIGFDGLVVESVYLDQRYAKGGQIDGNAPQFDLMAIEIGNLLDRLKRQEIRGVMPLNEMAIMGAEITMLTRVIGGDYLLVLVLSSNSDIQRGQTMLRLISPFIEREMK